MGETKSGSPTFFLEGKFYIFCQAAWQVETLSGSLPHLSEWVFKTHPVFMTSCIIFVLFPNNVGNMCIILFILYIIIILLVIIFLDEKAANLKLTSLNRQNPVGSASS